MSGGKAIMINRIIALCMVLLASVYLYATFKIPSLDSGDPVGPKAFPILIGIGFFVATLLLFVETKGGKAHGQEEKQELENEKRKLLLVIGGVVVWTAIFFAVFEPLGCLLSTAPYLFGLMSYFNQKKWWINAITSALFTIGIYALFGKLLGVNLAPGIMPF